MSSRGISPRSQENSSATDVGSATSAVWALTLLALSGAFLELFGKRLEVLTASRHQHDVSSRFDEGLGDGGTDALAGTGHYGPLSGQVGMQRAS